MKTVEYVKVPIEIYNRFIKNLEWTDVENPSMSEVEAYTGISSSKIRQDLKNIDCPLEEVHKGGKGKGNSKRFTKQSVEAYKLWLAKK